MDEAVVVPGMKTDTRLIQDIEGIDQGRPKGRSERNALYLTSRKGPGLPVQREIPQPHVPEVSEPAADFTQDKPACFIPRGHTKRFKKLACLINIHGIEPADVEPPQPI